MCTIIAGNRNGNIIIGRNFDWLQSGGKIHVLPSERKYGMQTQRHIEIEQQGVDRPYEGVNDSGVFIGMTSLKAEVTENENRVEFNGLGVMKFILERCKTVIEAINLLTSVKMHNEYDGNFIVANYLIADRQKNVFMYQPDIGAIEYKLHEGDLCILKAGVTIDKLRDEQEELFKSEKDMFRENLDMKAICMNRAVHDTAYSVVYNLENNDMCLYIEQNYGLPFQFKFEELFKSGKYTYDFGNLKLSRIKGKKGLANFKYRISADEASGFPLINEMK